MPGPVHLTLSNPKLEGLELKLDKTEVPAGGQAMVEVRYTPAEKPPPASIQAAVDVREAGMALQINIHFAR
jgi:hypothetical protein